MSRTLYTIVFERHSQRGVRVVVPLLPGFEFKSKSFQAALNESPKRIETFLKALQKNGKPIPSEPIGFRVETMLVEVKRPDKAK